MTYVVNESCIKCKLMDCVEVCPVDCFYEGENMLVIHPDECIDCGVGRKSYHPFVKRMQLIDAVARVGLLDGWA